MRNRKLTSLYFNLDSLSSNVLLTTT